MSLIVFIDASNLQLGGGLIHLQNLINFADNKKHAFKKIIVCGSRESLEKLSSKKFLELREYSVLNKTLIHRFVWQQNELSRLVEKENALLFVPGGLYLGKHRPFVTMFQNMQIFETSEKNREGFSKEWIRLHLLKFGQVQTFQNCSGLICLSYYAQNYLQQFYPKLLKDTNVRRITHGVLKTKKQSRGYGFKDKIKLLYVSTVKQYKHQWHLINAVALLKEQGFPLELHLIGAGERPALKRMHKAIQEQSFLGKFVYYHGHLNHPETIKWYYKADIFTYPSSCENLPNILLEAMAAGLPIACSDRGPMPEVLRDAGVYFNPEHPDSIAASLILLLKNESLRKTLGVRARNFSQAYSWERCADETFSFLSSVYNFHLS